MDSEVRNVIYMAAELLVSAAVIAVIATALYLGNVMTTAKRHKDASGVLLEQQAEMYAYLNSELTGSDVIDIILNYSNMYDFAVVKTNGDQVDFYVTRLAGVKTADVYNPKAGEHHCLETKQLGDAKLWTVDALEQDMGDLIYDKFIMRHVLTSDGYSIKCIVFQNIESGWKYEHVEKVKEYMNIDGDVSMK